MPTTLKLPFLLPWFVFLPCSGAFPAHTAVEKTKIRVFDILKDTVRPEFLNRIDEIIIFDNLTQEQIGEIVDIQVKRLGSRLAQMNIALVLSKNARNFLGEKGFDQIYGARPLKRAIQKYIENPLSMEILQGNISEGTKLKADVKGDGIVFSAV